MYHRANDWRAFFQSKDIAVNRLLFTVDVYDICDLNDRVHIRCREFSLGRTALDIKAENTEGRNFTFDLEWHWLNVSEIEHIELKLTRAFLQFLLPDHIVAFLELDPLHTVDVHIDHIAERKRHIGLVSGAAKDLLASESQLAVLDHLPSLRNRCRQVHVNLEEVDKLLLVVHDARLLDHLDVDDTLEAAQLHVEVHFDLIKVILGEIVSLALVCQLDVKVREEVVDVRHDTVS